jgi:hypothetical protein
VSGRALLAVGLFTLMDALLLGCGSSLSPVEGRVEAATEAGGEPDADVAPDAREAAQIGDDAGPTCVDQPTASGPVSVGLLRVRDMLLVRRTERDAVLVRRIGGHGSAPRSGWLRRRSGRRERLGGFVLP